MRIFTAPYSTGRHFSKAKKSASIGRKNLIDADSFYHIIKNGFQRIVSFGEGYGGEEPPLQIHRRYLYLQTRIRQIAGTAISTCSVNLSMPCS